MNYRFILQFELRLLNFFFSPHPFFYFRLDEKSLLQRFSAFFFLFPLFASSTTQKELISVILPSAGWLLGWMVGWMVVKVAVLGAWALLPDLLPAEDWCWALRSARWSLICWKLFWGLVVCPLSRVQSCHCCCNPQRLRALWWDEGTLESRAPLALLLRSGRACQLCDPSWLELWCSALGQCSPWIKGQGTSWNERRLGRSSQASSSNVKAQRQEDLQLSCFMCIGSLFPFWVMLMPEWENSTEMGDSRTAPGTGIYPLGNEYCARRAEGSRWNLQIRAWLWWRVCRFPGGHWSCHVVAVLPQRVWYD